MSDNEETKTTQEYIDYLNWYFQCDDGLADKLACEAWSNLCKIMEQAGNIKIKED